MDKPQVDAIEGIPPAIAIDQTNPVRTSRSTVGTMTELNDHLKLLFARAAKLHCRGCGKPVVRDTPELDLSRSAESEAGSAAGHHLPGRHPEELQREGNPGPAAAPGLHAHPRPLEGPAGGGPGPPARRRVETARVIEALESALQDRPGQGERLWTRPTRDRARVCPCGATPPTCTAPSATSTTPSRRRRCSRSTRRSAPARPAAASAASSASTSAWSFRTKL